MLATNRTLNSSISGGLTFDGNFTNGTGNTLTIATVNSSLVTMKGTNTYTGNTTISGTGKVSVSSIGNSGASGNLGAGTTINFANTTTSPGSLLYTGTGEVTSKIINLNGTTGGATIDQSGSGLLKFTGTNTASGNGLKTLTLQGSTAGTGEISGAIVNSTSATSLSKAGTSTWTLSGNNPYTGNTSINAGTLALSGTGSIASSPTIAVAGNATFDVSALNTTLTLQNAQTLSGTGTAASGIINCSTSGLTMGATTALALAYANGVPTFNVTGGAFTLASGNPVTVNVSGPALAAGDYVLISRTTGSVAGTTPTGLTIGGYWHSSRHFSTS